MEVVIDYRDCSKIWSTSKWQNGEGQIIFGINCVWPQDPTDSHSNQNIFEAIEKIDFAPCVWILKYWLLEEQVIFTCFQHGMPFDRGKATYINSVTLTTKRAQLSANFRTSKLNEGKIALPIIRHCPLWDISSVVHCSLLKSLQREEVRVIEKCVVSATGWFVEEMKASLSSRQLIINNYCSCWR